MRRHHDSDPRECPYLSSSLEPGEVSLEVLLYIQCTQFNRSYQQDIEMQLGCEGGRFGEGVESLRVGVLKAGWNAESASR